MVRENFEWRKTHGSEIRDLDRWSRGWKLVRLDGPPPLGQGGERNGRDVGVTSDGKEVVAISGWNSSWSMTKALKFQFLGTGLNGDLGEAWELMAVMTAVRTWYMEYISNAAATSNSSAGVAAAVS